MNSKKSGELSSRVKTVFGLVLITGFIFGMCFRFGSMMYLTNDDTSIQNYLSGRVTGSPYPMHQFISIFISYPIAWLYKIIPTVQWWFFYSQFLMLCGILLVNGGLWFVCRKNNIPSFCAVAAILWINLLLFLYPISNTSFTIVPAIIGTGALSLLFLSEQASNKKRLAAAIIVSLLFLISFCHRSDSGKVVLCYLILGLLYYGIKKQRKIRILMVSLAAIAVVILLAFGLDIISTNYKASINGESFKAFNNARSQYMDYPHDAYEDNPQLYENAGWDYDVYCMVNRWCFMDERVTEESFRQITNNSIRKGKEKDIGIIISRWKESKDLVLYDCKGIIWIIVIMVTIICSIIHKDRSVCIVSILNLLGTIMLIVYQLYTGRLLYRSVIICIIPSMVLSLLLFFKLASVVKWKEDIPLLLILLILCSSSEIYSSITRAFDENAKRDAISQSDQDRMVSDYVVQHGDDIFIKNIFITKSISPYTLYPDRKPANLLGWGGSEWGCHAHRIRNEKYGITTVTGDLFKRNNVYFVSDLDFRSALGEEGYEKERTIFFYIWLKHTTGAIGIKQIEPICDGIYVYKIIYTNAEGEKDVFDFVDGKVVALW